MDRRILCRSFCVCVALVALLVGVGQAAPVGAFISGSYHVAQKRDLGSQMQVVLSLRLVNRSEEALTIQKLSLASAGTQSRAANILIAEHGTVLTTQQFTVSRGEYSTWTRGIGPLLKIEGRSASGTKVVQMIRLDGFFGGGVR